MAKEITRLMVEVAISQGLKGMRQQFDRRVLRNAVEHGGRFSNGRYQKAAFQAMQEMLRTEDHPYFALCHQVVTEVDERYLMNYVVNLAYESWTQGAATIRRLEKEENCNIPWCITLFTSKAGQRMTADTAAALIAQGMEIGVMAYAVYEEDARADLIHDLCDRFPKCSFTVFLPDEKITDALLDNLSLPDNLAMVAMQPAGHFASYEKLRKHHCLFGLCRDVDAASAERMMHQSDLRLQSIPNAPIVFYRLTENCPKDVAEQFSAFVWQQKAHPSYPVFPIDLSCDLSRVDEIISDDVCRLSLAPDGTYLLGEAKTPAAMKFPGTSLHDAVRQLLKK